MRAMINSQQTRDIDTMLGQRRKRWSNIVLTLGQCDCLVFAGTGHHVGVFASTGDREGGIFHSCLSQIWPHNHHVITMVCNRQ